MAIRNLSHSSIEGDVLIIGGDVKKGTQDGNIRTVSRFLSVERLNRDSFHRLKFPHEEMAQGNHIFR